LPVLIGSKGKKTDLWRFMKGSIEIRLERKAAASYLKCFCLKYTQIYLLVRHDFPSHKLFFKVCK
jgi:hypothetical protein